MRVTRMFILNGHSVVIKQLNSDTSEQRNFKEDKLMNFETKSCSDILLTCIKVMTDLH
jgi:hypothetical protein